MLHQKEKRNISLTSLHSKLDFKYLESESEQFMHSNNLNILNFKCLENEGQINTCSENVSIHLLLLMKHDSFYNQKNVKENWYI